MFHSYLELSINHDQWMRLIGDPVNDVSRFKGSNTARPRFLSRYDFIDPKGRPLILSSSSSSMVFTIFVQFPS